jgi:inward rectifier potassium channel
MQTPSFDPGLTQQYAGRLRRAIDRDGNFDVVRTGGSWRNIHFYLHLINAPWIVYFAVIIAGYFIVNTIFALVYYTWPGVKIAGTDAPTAWARFLNYFFFSAHTLTTVGYGNFAPASTAANAFAAIEALFGLLGFAIATGLLFGRISKPSAKIGFSQNVLVAPYQDRTGLEFRIVNLRSNTLIDLQANVLLMTVDGPQGALTRRYQNLTLERNNVYFFPLTWTIVHPIDESSPLNGKTPQDLARLQAELLILIRGFDDTFSQVVNARFSYRYDEFVWGAKFDPAFHIDEDGGIVLDVAKLSDYTETPAAASQAEGSTGQTVSDPLDTPR